MLVEEYDPVDLELAAAADDLPCRMHAVLDLMLRFGTLWEMKIDADFYAMLTNAVGGVNVGV